MPIDERTRRLLVTELERARDRGVLGPGPVEDKLEHSRGFAECVGAAPTRLLDLGSGGGIPGLVLAALWEQTRITLLDASSRRCDSLRLAVGRLGWGGRVEVIEGRAEEVGHEASFREGFEVVTARSFGIPAVTAECSAAFLAPGGILVVSEPPAHGGATLSDGLRWPREGLAELGLSAGEALRTGGAGFQTIRRAGPISSRFPRRVGIPVRRPLWG